MRRLLSDGAASDELRALEDLTTHLRRVPNEAWLGKKKNQEPGSDPRLPEVTAQNDSRGGSDPSVVGALGRSRSGRARSGPRPRGDPPSARSRPGRRRPPGRARGRSPPRRGRRSPRASRRPAAAAVRGAAAPAPAPAPRRLRPRPPSRPVGLVVVARRPRRRPRASSASLVLVLVLFLVLLERRGLDLGLDLVAEVKLGVVVAVGGSSWRRRNSRSSDAGTSSWWAIQASVRPWRTQARI